MLVILLHLETGILYQQPLIFLQTQLQIFNNMEHLFLILLKLSITQNES